MKETLFTVALISALALLPINIFAQGTQNAGPDDANKLLQQMSKEFADEDYEAAIRTTTKLLAMKLTPKNRNTAFYVRGRSLFVTNFDNGKLRVDQSKPFKHSEAPAQNLRLAISDLVEVINYFRQNPPTESGQTGLQNVAYLSIASAYLNLGEYFSNQPADFAKAEEFFKLALPKHEDPNFANMQIVHCLAGQYKLYEARDLTKRVLASVPEEEYQRRLGDAIDAFDMMGEFHFTDALLLEQAGIRKAVNKSLKPISDAGNSRIAAQKLSLESANPTTVMELDRKGALLAITQQCDKAVAILEKTVSVNNSPTAARFLIPCLMVQQKFDVAWDLSNNLLDFDRNDVLALSFRAILLTMQDGEPQAKAEKAEADLSKAISVFPELASFYNGLENAKKTYQFQNKPNKVNEIAALERKFAELTAEVAKAGESDRIGDILDDDEENTKKPTPKPTPTPTAIRNEDSRLTESDKKALSDCQFVFEDAGCAKFVGKSLSEIQAYFGKSDSYGDYYRLGIHFWYYNDYKLEEITFQGVAPSQEYSPFIGKPGKKIDWNASPEEAVAQYGTPTNRNDMGSFGIDLTYGNVVFVFRKNKLINAVIKDFAAKAARENATAKNETKTTKPTQESGKSENERLQKKSEEEFLALIRWDNENATSTNASIKRQIDYGNGIKQSPRITIAGIIRSLDAAIKGREERIAQLETYLIGERLPPQNLEAARNLVRKIIALNKDFEGYREQYRNDLRNLR